MALLSNLVFMLGIGIAVCIAIGAIVLLVTQR